MDSGLGTVLRTHGLRMTRPRELVWHVLRATDRHLTVEEVAAEVNGIDPDVNLASVYRALALFADLDLVRETRFGSERASRWECAHTDDDFHLVCDSCGQVRHYTGDLVEQVRARLATDYGFHADGIDLVVTGRCDRCATKTNAPRRP